ncbi:MAG: hypothetical protein AB8H79_09445 [Myxococcota bacterium]
MKYTAAVLALAVSASASAHPFSTDTYSLANAVQIGDSGVSVVIILEVPVPVVLDDVKRRISEGTSKRKAVKEHDEARFSDMAKGLTLSINNTETPVTWRPVEHPSNGKVAEGFFLYWVGAKIPASDLDSGPVTVTVNNVAYADKKMVYTGIAEARPGWEVQSNSATEVLGVDVSTLGKTDKRAWTDDARLRTLTVTLKKTI